MSKALREVTVTKASAIGGILVLAIMPWFQGGRDPIGWMVMLGVALLGSFMLWRSPLRLAFNRLTVAWLALLIWTALSLIWTVNRYQTATTLMLYLFVGIIFGLAQALRTDKTANTVWRVGYSYVAAIAALAGMVLYVLFSYDRATSTFYLPNPFAAFLLPAIIIGLWRFAEEQKLTDGILGMISLGAFILTDSRGGALILAIIIFVALLLSQSLVRHWRRLVIVFAGAAALALLANVARAQVTHHFNFQGERYQQLTSDASTSTTDRLYFAKSALAIWADRPILGSGAGTYSTLHPKYQYRVISAGNNAHNFYVQTLSELGIVGLGLIGWIIIVLIMGVVKEVIRDPRKLPLALGLLALLLHAAVDIESNYPVLWALAAILAGLCYLPLGERKLHPRVLPSVLFATSIILALPTIWLFKGLIAAQNGSIAQDNGDYLKAAGYYQQATSHALYDPDWLSAEGINYYLQANNSAKDTTADLSKALALAQAATKQDPDDAQHDLLLGRIYIAQKQLALAEAADKQAVAKDPYDQPDNYNDLATVYLTQNKLAAAQSTINVVLVLYNPQVLANRHDDANLVSSVSTTYVISGEILDKQGQTSAARAQFEQALKLDPSNLFAKFELLRIGQ